MRHTAHNVCIVAVCMTAVFLFFAWVAWHNGAFK